MVDPFPICLQHHAAPASGCGMFVKAFYPGHKMEIPAYGYAATVPGRLTLLAAPGLLAFGSNSFQCELEFFTPALYFNFFNCFWKALTV